MEEADIISAVRQKCRCEGEGRWEGMHRWEGNPEGGKGLFPVWNPNNVRVSQGRGFPISARFSRNKSMSWAQAHARHALGADIFLHFLIYISQIESWEPEKPSCHGNKEH